MKSLSGRRVMALPIAAALITMGLKFWAFAMTGSVAILSDAAESLINLLAALIALTALSVAARPADATHMYGHEKAEYFSSGVEGVLITLAALGIGYQAVSRLIAPMPLANLPIGLGASIVAAIVNWGVARILLATAAARSSITLEAHAKHLLTDVWTTLGVVVGLGAVLATGWRLLDPAIALLVAFNIIRAGSDLLHRSASGLMDSSLPPSEVAAIEEIVQRYHNRGVRYHRLRARQSGAKRFVDFHLLVPGERSVQETHDLCELIEAEIKRALGGASITIHIEPLEDPASWEEAGESKPGETEGRSS